MSATYSIFTSPDHPPVKDHLPTLIVTPNGRPDHILYTYQHLNLNSENVIVSSAGVRVATLKPSRGIAALVGRTYDAAGNGFIRCDGGRGINWSLLNTGKQQAIYKVRVSGTDILQISKPNTQANFWTLFYFAPGGHMLPPKRVEFGRISRDKLGATVVSIFGRNTDERGIWSIIGEENEDAVEWIVLSAALVVLDGEIVTVAEKSGYDLSGQTRVSTSTGAVRSREGEIAAQKREPNGGTVTGAAGAETRGTNGGAAMPGGAALPAGATGSITGGRVPYSAHQNHQQERQERARIEQARQEQARQDQMRQEQARHDQMRQEQARQEQARQEQARQEQARQEQARQEDMRQRQAAAQQQELFRQRQLAEQQEHIRQRQLAEYQQEQLRQRQMAEQQEQERRMQLERQEQLRQRQLAEQRLQMPVQAEPARKEERTYQEHLRQEQMRGQRGQDPRTMPTAPIEYPTQHMLASEQQQRQAMEQRQRQLSRERKEQQYYGHASQEYEEQQRFGQMSREQQDYVRQRQALEQQEQMRQRKLAQQQHIQMQQMSQEQLRQKQAQHIRDDAIRPAPVSAVPPPGRPVMKQRSSSEVRTSLTQRSGTPASQSSHGTSVHSSPSKKKFYQTQDNYYGSVATTATEGAPPKLSFSLFKKR